MFRTLRKIAFKLAILAGVPVVGVLLLSGEIANDQRDRARSAEAIGSIEDLAELSARMTVTVDQLQSERASAALVLGLYRSVAPPAPNFGRATASLLAQEGKTDAAMTDMNAFLAERDLKRLPRRLQSHLLRARASFAQARDERQKLTQGTASIAELLDVYGAANDALVDATAALTRLSNDGEILRALSSLVVLMQVKEGASREQAVLSHTFATGEFAPGMYRYLVTLITEETVHSATLQSFATSDQVAAYQRTMALPASARASAMVNKALEATEDSVDIDPNDWFETQQTKVHDLAAIEEQHAQAVREIAQKKVQESQRAVRYGEELVIAVVLVSLALAFIIGRSITRSVLSLVGVAGKVQREKDFSLRAQKTTSDEVGALADAFNEMLAVIQERDQELHTHRQNLEQTVTDRTLELSKRNQDMRLVLDTVEQGLATIDEQGRIEAERSRAFDVFFGAPAAHVPFFEHIAGGELSLSATLEQGWSKIAADALSPDFVPSQAKTRITLGERHFALAYQPIVSDGAVGGALLTISDVTTEMAEAATRERLERELQLAQKLEGVGQLAAGVAHEINTPMQYVGDNIAFLTRAFDKLGEHISDAQAAVSPGGATSLDDARARLDASQGRLKLGFLTKNVPKALQDAAAGIAHVSSIVRAMKSFAHVDGDEKTTGDLNQALRDTLVVAQNEYKASATVETDLGALPSVLCFPGKLNQVFLNLIVNAAHAVADAKREGGKICVSSRAEDGVVAVTISDNGLGIPQQIQHKVFDPFFTTKPVGKGTGQGLSISRSIVVDAHGGTLSFETEPGQGTAFTVRLPIDGHTRLAVAS
ncbi:MAG TPA: nitrate- and nitrite sensing domain-containing protein [Polyangiaceae bacterium]|nr:nitrate- and nitrite sensing domain-containing protein [Polyangiaceae bacterium]